ncbi:MAG: SIMPL domain-containing protein [Chitinophagales bacterium]|nr:SIMPL domain-containing protein [Chitinophagales bacterium]
MRLQLKTIYLSILFCVATLLTFAQTEDHTIKVTGSSTVNVSPNEIIIKVQYQEYFDGDEREENRVTIDQIEAKVLKALGKARIEDDKITLGGISVVRPSIYRNNERVFLKRRLNKSLFICVVDTDQLLKVVRALEEAQLMDEVITIFEIVETKHTDIEDFKKQVKIDAFKDAVEKANLILSTSEQQVGDVINVKEYKPYQQPNPMEFSPSTYEVAETPSSQISGFKPIQVTYRIEVVFEIE